jgi:hypothetical protein
VVLDHLGQVRHEGYVLRKRNHSPMSSNATKVSTGHAAAADDSSIGQTAHSLHLDVLHAREDLFHRLTAHLARLEKPETRRKQQPQ